MSLYAPKRVLKQLLTFCRPEPKRLDGPAASRRFWGPVVRDTRHHGIIIGARIYPCPFPKVQPLLIGTANERNGPFVDSKSRRFGADRSIGIAVVAAHFGMGRQKNECLCRFHGNLFHAYVPMGHKNFRRRGVVFHPSNGCLGPEMESRLTRR